MIRLIVAAIVCIALQPAATGGRAHAAESTIGAALAGGDHLAPAAVDFHLDVAGAWAMSLAPVAWIALPSAAPRSALVVARLWLRGQRLLC